MSRKFKFHSNLTRKAGAFCEDQYTFLIVSLSVLRMRNVLDKSCRENHNTHFVFNNLFFFGNRAVYEIMWKNVVQPDRPHNNMGHAHCMLDN